MQNGPCEIRNILLAGQQLENDITQQLQTKIFLKDFRDFILIWCDLKTLVISGNHLVVNLPSSKKKCCIGWSMT